MKVAAGVVWLANEGDGNFVSTELLGLDSSPLNVAAGDVNGDGAEDLVTIRGQDGEAVYLFTAQANGDYVRSTIALAGRTARDVTLGDLDGDARPEIVVATNDNTVGVWANDGNGSFSGPVAEEALSTASWRLSLLDLDSDGRVDIVSANANAGTVSVLLQEATGGFEPAVDYLTGPQSLNAIGTDLDGDGYVDLVVPNQSSHYVSVLLNNGTGQFGAADEYPSSGSPAHAASADFDGNGTADLAVVNEEGELLDVFLADGSGTLGAYASYPAKSGARYVRTGDMNSDGTADIVVSSNATFLVYLNDGAGLFGDPLSYGADAPHSFVVEDMDSDGRLDIAAANAGAQNYRGIRLLHNHCLP